MQQQQQQGPLHGGLAGLGSSGAMPFAAAAGHSSARVLQRGLGAPVALRYKGEARDVRERCERPLHANTDGRLEAARGPLC